MAKLNRAVPHELPQGEALRRIRGEIEDLKREYGDKVGKLRGSWNNDTYVFDGMTQGVCSFGSDTGEAVSNKDRCESILARRRYQCRTCGKTFCLTTRTPYYRLQHRRAIV